MTLPIKERNDIQEKSKLTDMYWGFFWSELNHIQGPQFDEMTLSQLAQMELSAIERILARAFPAL